MATLELKNLTKRFGDFVAVDQMNLKVAEGEIVALLGESGCGKTTTLRMIAGFTQANEGQVVIDGRVMNDIPPYKRNVGIFFQNYALFPHLTTFDNVAFGLKLKKLPKNQVAEKVARILELVRLTGMEKRYPRELSGGQQQRVALARALVTEPSVLLLDEPLSNLDAKLRAEMQIEIKRIQQNLGITTIIVTHDQEEAVSLAQRVIVMNKGVILQVGPPKAVFDRPESLFVADFMGFANFIAGRVGPATDELTQIHCPRAGGEETVVYVPSVLCGAYSRGAGVRLAIRPENILIKKAGPQSRITGEISSVTYKGNTSRLEISGAFAETIYVHIHDYDGPEAGRVALELAPEKLLVYPA